MIWRSLCATAGILVLVGLFAAATGLDWHAPLLPRERVALPADDFRIITGTGTVSADALAVTAAGDEGSALQTASVGVRAENLPILSYTFEHFPRTLELSLVFRRADAPGEVQAVTIPWPGDGATAVDLRRFPAWHGEITELGFGQFATGQLVPGSVAFAPFRLRSAQLSSPSWSGAWRTQCSDWFGYRPWALSSINSLNSAAAVVAQPVIAVVAVLVFMAAVVAAGARWRRRSLWAAALAAAGGWILLDGWWLHNFASKHALTETLYARRSPNERERLAPGEDLTFIAMQTRDWLAAQHESSRLLVAADTAHNFFRLIYLLLPHDTAALYYVGGAQVPAGTLILLYGSSQWEYDAAAGVIRGQGGAWPVVPVYSSGGARLYRATGAPP